MNLTCHTQGCDGEPTSARKRFCDPCTKAIAKARAKAWADDNPDKVAATRLRHAEAARERSRRWHADNPDRARAQAVKWYEANKEKAIARTVEWVAENRSRRCEISRASARRLRDANPDKFNEAKRKRRESPEVRLCDSVSAAMRISLRGSKGGAKWESLVGYTVDDLMTHLESQFSLGMTFENYGDWHVDHKRPMVSFAFLTPDDDEFKQCWALSNLQPLWAVDNIRKNSNWNGVRITRAPIAEQHVRTT